MMRLCYRLIFLITIVSANCSLFISNAWSVTIYPIDRAIILNGSLFDFRIEFSNQVNPQDIKVMINGLPLSQFSQQTPIFIPTENGLGSSLILKDMILSKPGPYKISVTDGKESGEVHWEVFGTGSKKVKNVILFVGDGMTIANRTAARVLSKGITQGKYNGRLAFDDMPYTAMIGTSGSDSLITDSANSMSAYTTGHKTAVNAMGVYVSRARENLEHPKVETIAEIIKRKTNMSVGVVSDAEIEDATPAAMVAHTRRRADKQYIADQFFTSGADVILGGGTAYFLPQSAKDSKRKDDRNLIESFMNSGYQVSTTKQELRSDANDPLTKKLFGTYHPDNMDGSLDRFVLKQNTVKEFPNQPDLTEMTEAALKILSKNPNGFFLMVEAALIDKFNHPLDWERAAFDTIMLSNAVQVAKDFAKTHPDTLIIVVPDHTHSGSIAGVVDDLKSGALRDKVGVYAEAGFPNYPNANDSGYPEKIDVTRRLAFFYGNYPDHYETMRPKLDGTFIPAIKNSAGKYIANPKYQANHEDAIHMPGNLPSIQESGVHTADDAVLNAMGPAADRFKGFMDNTEVFRAMVEALGLGK